MTDTTKPESLRLADALEYWAKDYATTDFDCEMGEKAAAEVRRLHGEVEALKIILGISEQTCKVYDELNLKLSSENDALRKDAECFRFWVREAASAPGDMAKLIANCVTEQDYRNAITPVALAAKKAIDAAMKEKP